MRKLEKIEKEILEIKESLHAKTFMELKLLVRKCTSIEKYLMQRRSSTNRKLENNLQTIKRLQQLVKNTRQEVKDRIIEKEEQNTNWHNYKKESPKNNRTEREELKSIKNSDKTLQEKIKEIEEFTTIIQAKIDYLLAENAKLKLAKRENYSYAKNAVRYDIDKQIRSNLKEIEYQRNILQECKGILISLLPKEKVSHTKRKISKNEKDNHNQNYYEIMLELLNDDQNYLFIKALIKQNKNFVNARSKEKRHIIFEIEDRYIKNTKLQLVNQKLVHENQIYFYSILRLLLQEKLDLSNEEELLFTETLNLFLKKIEEKRYKEYSKIKKEVYALFQRKQESQKEKINTNRYQREFAEIALSYNKRVNLTEEYLKEMQTKITEFQDQYFKEHDRYPELEEIKNTFQIPIYDIKNSISFGKTFTIENTHYAFTICYDNNYNTYFRIHVLDTTLLKEECDAIKQMKENKNETSRYVRKALKFRQNGYYPTITYQFKIDQSRIVNSFKIFESTIKIEKVYENKVFLDYREDNTLKEFVGNVKAIANFYDFPLDEITTDEIQERISFALNDQVKKYFEQNSLPSLYYTELEMEESTKEKLHNSVCYYLGRIPVLEVYQFLSILKESNKNRFYTMTPLEESKIELDARNYLGYMNLRILKYNLHGLTSLDRLNLYEEELEECEKNINNDAIFLDYFTKRKLIRLRKGKEQPTE